MYLGLPNWMWWTAGGAAVLIAATKTYAQEDAQLLELSVNVRGKKPLLEQQRELARLLREELPAACPGAPLLNKTLKRKPVDLDDGVRIVYTFDATFAGDTLGFVRKEVGECIYAFIQKNAGFGSQVVGIRAKRIA